ncbi:SGNH/GDSL hydrolase family protein [Bacillus timonensis]|uniref:SGNH/GDSL hydrolase family protein n=1 Tax=Bacillus timonensis TaxID=1033734 RepID=UPI0003140E5C|nr:SGNH/GDSL hydrolase family protein [Bacillus timonensis]
MRMWKSIRLFYFVPIFICVLIVIVGNGNVELFPFQQTSKAADLESKETSIIQKLHSHQPVTIVAYGDSITWGYERDATSGKIKQVKNPYPKVLEKELRKKFGYRQIKVINNGHPGWTSIQAIENVKKEVLRYKPDLVILMFGINDARGHNKYSPNALPVPVDHYRENNHQLLQMMKEKGIEVVLISATTVTSKKNNANKTQVHYTNAIQFLAQEENVHYVNGTEIPIKGNLSDGIHFKADHYRLIAEKLMVDVFD